MTLNLKIKNIDGPILILGAGGFIGSHLFKTISHLRSDCFGTIQTSPCWRLPNLKNTFTIDLEQSDAVNELLYKIKPRTIFNLASYGNRNFHQKQGKIISLNFLLPHLILSFIESNKDITTTYIHTGSSSEYGSNCHFADEGFLPAPNSIYSITKLSASHLVHYYGKMKNIACINLRFFSIYGPYEDHDRLIPSLVLHGMSDLKPKISSKDTSRDFVFIDDAIKALLTCCSELKQDSWGESLNICTGIQTSLRDVIELTANFFPSNKHPTIDASLNHIWDIENWSGNPSKTEKTFAFKPTTQLTEGIEKTFHWYQTFLKTKDLKPTNLIDNPRISINNLKKISIIVACHNDEKSIPEIAEKVQSVAKIINCQYELIFVENRSTDNSQLVLKQISSNNSNIKAIIHSDKFSTQASFKSGMEMAVGDACVLMDGDLQDPPELIESFYKKWIAGSDVVVGTRISRDGPVLITFCQMLFYRLFNFLSYHPIPKDAGDFSLMDRKVVKILLMHHENKPFWRIIRARVGFTQDYVSYHRPERKYGKSTNNIFRNIDWVIYGVMGYENKIIFYFALILFISLPVILSFLEVPIFLSMIISSLTTMTFLIPLLYLKRILEEIRPRPLFVRSKLIRNGKVYDF